MEDQQQFLNPPPLTSNDVDHNSTPYKIDKDILQLHADVINVLENRVDISTFPPDRQKRIKDYYRFAPVDMVGPAGEIAQAGAKRIAKG